MILYFGENKSLHQTAPAREIVEANKSKLAPCWIYMLINAGKNGGGKKKEKKQARKKKYITCSVYNKVNLIDAVVSDERRTESRRFLIIC